MGIEELVVFSYGIVREGRVFFPDTFEASKIFSLDFSRYKSVINAIIFAINSTFLDATRFLISLIGD